MAEERKGWVVITRTESGAWRCGGYEPKRKQEAHHDECVARILGGYTVILRKAKEHSCEDCTEEAQP